MKVRKAIKRIIPLLSLLLPALSLVSAQSGRKASKPPPASPPAAEAQTEKPGEPKQDRNKPQIAAVAGEEYKCTDDGSLAVVIQSNETEKVFAPNEVTIKARITSRPVAEYTKEARRRAVEGIITVRAILSSNGKVASVKILKGLPFGLNESAIRAGCKIEFVPASKDGQRVTQWLKTEYIFRLESSIFRP